MPRAVRYRVLKKIADGGMAEIFLASQVGAEGFQKTVVLKRILPTLAADPTFVGMLVDEAHIASTLNHSNLVQVLDLGKAEDQFFLVLEFVDGWSLEHVRRRAQKARVKLPLPLALYITGALCRGLAYVHTRKHRGKSLDIVHRDVTPHNVLLSREGEVKLADFGIAKATSRREKSATGVIKGKFSYMSPEQSIGGDMDHRSDLFSVGTLLYILTTGKKPFDGVTDMDVLMQVRKAKFEKPSEIVKDFNPDVERFIIRALRSDRSKRWQSAEAMGDRIDGIIAKLGLPTGPALLKRWLADLAKKDGMKAPAEADEPTTSGTIELGSRDLELHDVPGAAAPAPAAPDDDAPTGRHAAPNTRAAAAGSRAAAAAAAAAGNAAAAGAAGKSARDDEPPPAVARFGRFLRRAAITTAILVVTLGGAAYFARPYLPAWMVKPVEAWVRQLPPPLGDPPPPAPSP